MFRLGMPPYTYSQTLEICCKGITGNTDLLKKLSDNSVLLQTIAGCYEESASKGELYTIQATQNNQNNDPTIIGELKKSNLIKLYSTYFVKKGKPARIIYDAIMAAAKEKCPFCGGIGRPRNLDHYLPKAHYPQFSVLPLNLVPSCRDCNMDGKGSGFATNEEGQVLQPYLDHDRYFCEQWVFASYLPGVGSEPGVVEYFVEPPEYWSNAQKRRVEKHFNDFELGLRFSKEAGPRLVTYLAQIHELTGISLSIEVAKNVILQPVVDSAPYVNHWERVMCLALMDSLELIDGNT